MKIMATVIPTDLVTKLLLSLFFSFLRKQKQESNLQKIVALITRGISIFYLQRVTPYITDMPNPIDFCKDFSFMLFLFVLQFDDYYQSTLPNSLHTKIFLRVNHQVSTSLTTIKIHLWKRNLFRHPIERICSDDATLLSAVRQELRGSGFDIESRLIQDQENLG